MNDVHDHARDAELDVVRSGGAGSVVDRSWSTRAASWLPTWTGDHSRARSTSYTEAAASPGAALEFKRKEAAHVRDRRLRRQPSGPGDPPGRAREARIPRLRLRRHLAAGRGRPRRRARRRQPRRTCAPPWRSATARATAASPCSRRRPRPASATRAGPPTAASPRRTRTRTSTPPTASTSWSTASSRTTWSSSRSCSTPGAVFTSETDAEVIAHLISRHLDGNGARARPCGAPTRACAATTRSWRSPPTSPA